MKYQKNGFVISTDKELLQIDMIHKYLSEEAYWCKNIPKEPVQPVPPTTYHSGGY